MWSTQGCEVLLRKGGQWRLVHTDALHLSGKESEGLFRRTLAMKVARWVEA